MRRRDGGVRACLTIADTFHDYRFPDNTVLVGRASPIILSRAPHTLRVRVDAPEPLRARRVEQRVGLVHDSALEYLRRTDRDRAARVRFLYGVDLGDPLLYDLVLDTDRLDVEHCARLVEKALDHERFRSTAESRRTMQDESLVAQARAALRAHPTTRARQFAITCVDGVITLEGGVDAAQLRQVAEEAVARIPGVSRVQNEIVVAFEPIVNEADELSHHQFRHGEERSWGGYGGGWYDREWEARRQTPGERKN